MLVLVILNRVNSIKLIKLQIYAQLLILTSFTEVRSVVYGMFC